MSGIIGVWLKFKIPFTWWYADIAGLICDRRNKLIIVTTRGISKSNIVWENSDELCFVLIWNSLWKFYNLFGRIFMVDSDRHKLYVKVLCCEMAN